MPFVIADGTIDEFLAENPENQPGQELAMYCPYIGANPDGVDQIRLLADNTFGFEDMPGGVILTITMSFCRWGWGRQDSQNPRHSFS
ncbi:MAG: hypothetical protein HC838_01445 [Spirulinaceae cyanobacterium RM2_2_10]|nr:hypothetical protein [Spirulinaceae cyanobacterium RM2_2_10]